MQVIKAYASKCVTPDTHLPERVGRFLTESTN